MKFKVENISPKDYQSFYHLLATAFEIKASDFRPFIENFPQFSDDDVFIIKDGNKVVASIQVLLENVYFNNQKMLCGGIGQVAALPEYRGKGFAGMILDATITYMKSKKVDYSLLFAGPVPLYNKYGWKELPVKTYFADIKGKVDLKIDTSLKYKIEEYSSNMKYDVYQIHQQFIQNFNGLIVRNPVYWEQYVRRFKAKKNTYTYVLKNQKKVIVAYTIVEYDDKALNFFEYGAYDNKNEEYFKILLKNVINHFKPKKVFLEYGNKNYVPAKVLKKYLQAKTKSVYGFMVRNVKKNINWEEAVDKILFFPSDSF